MHAGVGNRRVPKETRVAVRVALSLLVLSVPAFRGRHGWVDHPQGFIAVELVLLLVLVATDTWMRTRTSAQAMTSVMIDCLAAPGRLNQG